MLLPKKAWQWFMLYVSFALLTAYALIPPSATNARVVFHPPTRADLLMKARPRTVELTHHERAVAVRVSQEAPKQCGSRSVVFAHNFELSGELINLHAVYICPTRSSQGETLIGLTFTPHPDSETVNCNEEYSNVFQTKPRPSGGMVEYVSVEQDWKRVKRAARSPAEACVLAHSVEILDSIWLDE